MSDLLTFYLKLRWTLFLRKLSGHGIKPLLIIAIGLVALLLAIFYLPKRTEFAAEIVAALSLYFISLNSNKDRSRFLQFQFGDTQRTLVNGLEAVLITLPGVLVTLIYGEIWLSLVLIAASIILAISNFSLPQPSSIPTPYGKTPFEFILGFRTAYWTYILVIAALLIGYFSQNANLSFFSLIIISLLHIGFYQKPEAPQWVIIFKQNVSGFIWLKCKQALLYHNLTLLPFAIIQFALFNESLPWIILLFVLSNIYLMTTIFLKYSAYPNEVQITDGVIFAISLVVPPLLLLTIPVLYHKSKKHLQQFL